MVQRLELAHMVSSAAANALTRARRKLGDEEVVGVTSRASDKAEGDQTSAVKARPPVCRGAAVEFGIEGIALYAMGG
jgi:hypothetical protein